MARSPSGIDARRRFVTRDSSCRCRVRGLTTSVLIDIVDVGRAQFRAVTSVRVVVVRGSADEGFFCSAPRV